MRVNKFLVAIFLAIFLIASPAMAVEGDPVYEGSTAGSITIKGATETAFAGAVTTYTSTRLTGVGTDFTIFNPGDSIKLDGTVYTIAAIGNATAMTLTAATADTDSYSITYDSDLLSVSNAAGVELLVINNSGLISGKVGFAAVAETAIATADTLTFVAGKTRYLVGSDGAGGYTAVTMTSNPQVADGIDAQEIRLMGRSDTNTVAFVDGSGLATAAAATATLGLGDFLDLMYNVADDLWYETGRSDN